MSNYPWLKERKYQATVEKSRKNKELPSPVHAGYGSDIAYTGNGNPNSVAEYAQDGQPIHKGELKFGNTGDQVITDAMSSKELMSNPVIAKKVNGYKGGGYGGRKGYQTGGLLGEENTPTGESVDPAGNPIGVSLPTGGAEDSPTSPQSPIPTTTPNIAAPNTDAQVAPTVDPGRLRKKGIGAIENILDTGSVAGRVAGQKQISDLKSTQNLERQVQKQEAAQRGLGESQASGQMARLTGEQGQQLSDLESNVAIEKLQAQERAAGRLAAEGKVQTDIEIAKSVQGLNEAQFGEFVRQFEVGSGQWDTAFEERRRQFEVGSDQWNQSFEEQRNMSQKSFDEQIRQFDVGSEQWNTAHKDNQEFQWKTFDEQKRQFEVGSDQWETANGQQQDQWRRSFDEQRRQFDKGSDQWNKSFNEERRRYDNEDDKWWASFDEQREQFDVGTEQWQDSFNQQKHQFDVGSEQWNKAHGLQVKEFAQKVDMDKHSVDVWKNNVDYRDKAYLDTLSMEQQRLAMETAVHEKNMELTDYKLDATKQNDQTEKYWADSERIHNYAAAHLDGFDEKTGIFTPDAENEMFKWFSSKYPGSPASKFGSPDDLSKNSPEEYQKFRRWASTEWKAATDKRLTNPFDKMLYDVESSGLDESTKESLKKVLTSPEALAGIAGVHVDPDSGKITIIPKETPSTSTGSNTGGAGTGAGGTGGEQGGGSFSGGGGGGEQGGGQKVT